MAFFRCYLIKKYCLKCVDHSISGLNPKPLGGILVRLVSIGLSTFEILYIFVGKAR